MSNIIDDVFQDIEVRPKKSKIILKWTIRISIILISAAFIVGQFKIVYFNRLNNIEKSIENNNLELKKTNDKIDIEFDKINTRIDNIYVDGVNAFIEFNDYNKKQLELIIDYNKTDKTFLKRMLDINTIEKNKNVENKLKQIKAN